MRTSAAMNMPCTSCGAPLAAGSTFCGTCGKPQQPATASPYGASSPPYGAPPPYGAQPSQPYGAPPPQPPYGAPPPQPPYGAPPPPQPYGAPPPQGYSPYPPGPPQMQQLTPAEDVWRWHYSRFVGVMYGPIPVGIIVVAIVFAAYYGSR